MILVAPLSGIHPEFFLYKLQVRVRTPTEDLVHTTALLYIMGLTQATDIPGTLELTPTQRHFLWHQSGPSESRL